MISAAVIGCAIGDDRERFERLHRQLLRRALVKQPAHPFVQIRARHDLIAAGDLDQLQAARPLVVLLQRRERRLRRLPSARCRAACTSPSASADRATRRSTPRGSPSIRPMPRVGRLSSLGEFAAGSTGRAFPVCLSSATISLRIANRMRRIGRPRSFVDANRAEAAGLEHPHQLQSNHLEQRQKGDDQAAAIARRRRTDPRSRTLRSPTAAPAAARCGPRPASAPAAAAPSAGAWRARRPPGTRSAG